MTVVVASHDDYGAVRGFFRPTVHNLPQADTAGRGTEPGCACSRPSRRGGTR